MAAYGEIPIAAVTGGNWRMPQNFIEGSREQGFLLPADVREWLPADPRVPQLVGM